MSLTRAQKISLLLAALAILVIVSWAMDWYTSSGFWRAFVRILFEVIAHLGK